MKDRITVKTLDFLSILPPFIEPPFFIVTKCLPCHCIHYFTSCAKTFGFKTTSGTSLRGNASDTAAVSNAVCPSILAGVVNDRYFYCKYVHSLNTTYIIIIIIIIQ